MASSDSTIALVIELEPAVQRLAGVTAVGERPRGLDFMQGFEQRRLRGMGRFLTRDEIAKRPSAHLADLVRSMLGTEMMIDDEGYVIARASRGERSLNVGADGFPCKAPIFVDGIERVGEPLERIARAPEVEGIEFYAGAASLPIQFRHGDSSCGVVLV